MVVILDCRGFRLEIVAQFVDGAWNAGARIRRTLSDMLSGARRLSGAAERRICVLCGRAFALVMPPDEEETDPDKLCPVCLALPAPSGESGQ